MFSCENLVGCLFILYIFSSNMYSNFLFLLLLALLLELLTFSFEFYGLDLQAHFD